MSDPPVQADMPAAEIVYLGVYVQDFNRFSVEEGLVEVNFYLTIRSDTNASIDDLEIMNGQVTSMDVIRDDTDLKVYRLITSLSVDPDLRRYPFDRHTISIEFEPKLENDREMVLAIDQKDTGLDEKADIPGWGIVGTGSFITNKSYVADEVAYSRAVFDYRVQRDVRSTVLKFFLPIMLIIIVALCSMMLKTSARLGLSASMFLSSVLIHWRMVDAIPIVGYTTFLDLFMIITYSTLVMVLISGILVLKYVEAKDPLKVEKVNRWSIRVIPVLSFSLYAILFISLAF
jgi:hypothetical protein